MSESQLIDTLTLVTTNGDLIEIECPEDIFEEVLEDFRDARSRLDYWYVGNWCDARAMFKGVRLSEINMGLIIGTH